MECRSVGVHALTPLPAVRQVRRIGHHAWISGNDSFQVHPLERIRGDKMQCNKDLRVLCKDSGKLSKWVGPPYELRPSNHGEQRGK
jgi:hypothetical protein